MSIESDKESDHQMIQKTLSRNPSCQEHVDEVLEMIRQDDFLQPLPIIPRRSTY